MGIDAKIRKYQYTLIYSGRGLVSFAVWNLIKNIIFAITDNRRILENINLTTGDRSEYVLAIYLFFLFSSIFLEAVIKIYISRCAIAEGRVGKRGRLYLIVAIVFVGYSLWVDFSNMYNFRNSFTLLNDITDLLLDLSSNLALVVIIVTAFRMRALIRKEGVSQSPVL